MITLQNIIEANYDRNIIVYKELETGQMCLVSDQEVLALQYDPKIKIARNGRAAGSRNAKSSATC